jgi:hypothetical protein
MQEVSLLETMDSGDAIIANVMHDKLFEETLVDNIANQLYRLIDQNSGARLVLDLSNVVMVCSVAVYSVKRALLEICESVMTPEWIPSSSDRMSPKGRLKSIDWSIS